MRNNSTVLITGINGFIGSHAARQLMPSHRVIGIGNQSHSPIACEYYQVVPGTQEFGRVLGETRPDFVVHCAGSASVSRSLADPEHDFQSGPSLVFRLYNSLRASGLRPHVIQISSAAVYGNPARLPVREHDPVLPLSPYGWHKLQSEQIGREFAALYRIPGMALRVFSCYGEGQRKLLLWDAARKLMAHDPQFYGTGRETRDYIHVRDVARLIRHLIQAQMDNSKIQPEFSSINVASGTQTSVEQIISMLAKALDLPDVRPCFAGEIRPGDPARWQADISAMQALGFYPAMTLAEGIKTFAHWFVTQGMIHEKATDSGAPGFLPQ